MISINHHSVFSDGKVIVRPTEIKFPPSLFLSQVAKDVSIRLHSQLDSVEKKRSRLEQENEELRVRLQDLEVAKQVLQQEIDKVGSQSHKLWRIEPEEAMWRSAGLITWPTDKDECCLLAWLL